jgi:hypothetical protein
MHVQDFMGHDGEAIMQDMISEEGDYTTSRKMGNGLRL